MTTATHSFVVFPCFIGAMCGVDAVEIGARYVWVHMRDSPRVRILRSQFTPDELQDTMHKLAFRASHLVYASLNKG